MFSISFAGDMAKTKKNKPYRQPLLSYYKGPKTTVPIQLDDSRINEIKKELSKYENKSIKLGLSSALRSIKNGRSRAIFYDSSAPSYLTKFLLDHSHEHKVPCLGISNLQSTISKKIKSLLLMSVESSEDPSLNQFISTLKTQFLPSNSDHRIQEFANPDILKVLATGKSKSKKDKKKQDKKDKREKESIQT